VCIDALTRLIFDWCLNDWPHRTHNTSAARHYLVNPDTCPVRPWRRERVKVMVGVHAEMLRNDSKACGRLPYEC